MVDMNKIVSVKNRNHGWTGYEIPDNNIRRIFTPGEAKNISINELWQLQNQEGGDYLLQHCFLIEDKEALGVLNMSDVEPEYFYTEQDVRKLLSEGSLEQLEDALNFAPKGVINLIEAIAVETEVPDTKKRQLISEKTDINIDSAIMVNRVMAENDNNTPEVKQENKRKAAPINERKAAPLNNNKYKVVR